jgi:membrane dipeptidase
MTRDIAKLYADTIVLDAAVPVLAQDPGQWKRYAAGGVTAVLATVATHDDIPATIDHLCRWYKLVERHPDALVLAESVADIEAAKRDGRLAVVFHFQNGRPLGHDAAMVEVFRRLGVRVIQLTYNYRNNLGDGCLEPENAGLSRFGRAVVRRMNEQNVLVDLSHTGVRTTLDAMDVSERPDVFTHANARGVHDHPRNLTDGQIRKVAEKGGVIGLCSFPAFITDKTDRPTIAHLIEHLDYFVQLAGIDHVGLGVDYYEGHGYQSAVDLGVWDPGEYPAPPWYYPLDGGNTVEFAEGLVKRGYVDEDVRKVLGGNFLRVFSQVWGR